MTCKTKLGISLFVSTLAIAWVGILTFPPHSESEDYASAQDLMDSMRISRVTDKVKAPDFMLSDLEGNRVRLSDHRGKVVMLNFWTTW
jgi:cytochrome oxidase Cu insertion factor (SCO1/SenC/PrrC family)